MTATILAHTESQPLNPQRSTGRGAGSAAGSGESFQAVVDAAGKSGRRDSRDVVSEDVQEPEVDAKGHGDPGDTEVEPALAKLLGELHQTKRSDTGLQPSASDQQKGERATTLTPLVSLRGLGTGADTAPAHAAPKPDGAQATILQRPTLPATALDRSNLLSKAFEVPQDAEVAVRALGGSVDGRPNPTRVDLVSMRTDFQPADTVALDGQVRSVGPTLTASGFGRFLASADARGDMNRTDEAEASSDADGEASGEVSRTADGQDDGPAIRRRSSPGAEPADKNARIAGKGDKNSPDGKIATGNSNWSVDDPNVDMAVVNDPAAGGRPSRQVASAVTNALADLRPVPGTVGDDGRLHLRAGGAALKTIQIQLQPEQLGKLDVTMRLVDGQLAIHLVASKAETALRLKDDAEGLKTLLSKAGFSVDDAAISIAVRDPATQRSPSALPSANAGADGGGRTGNGSAEDGRFEHRQSSREEREGRREQAPSSPPQAGPAIARRHIDPSTYL